MYENASRISSSALKYSVIVSAVFYCAIVSNLASAEADYSRPVVRDTVHINQCGSCHLPYSPGLLPVQSWNNIMAGLDSHFGQKLEVSIENIKHILAYLEKYALESGQQSIMGQLAKNLPEQPSLRITELPAFVSLHEVVKEELELDELKTGFLSPCEDCHRAAASHMFNKELLSTGHSGGLLSDYK